MPGFVRAHYAANAFILIALLAGGCGGAENGSKATTPAATEAADDNNDIVSSDPRIQYFHEQLVINGEDLQSDFGGFLLTLKMHARDLQQDDPKHAYDMVLEEVRKVPDPAMRQEMARTFFNTPDVPQ